MELSVMLLIMLATGFVGGCVNYFLPSNRKQDGTIELTFVRSIVLGIGATLLVPIFLNTVDSQLMDDIKISCKTPKREITQENSNKKQLVSTPISKIDSAFLAPDKKNVILAKKDSSATKKDSLKSPKDETVKRVTTVQESKDSDNNTGKKYLLWGAYCTLAAIAGFKFIELTIKNVLRDQEVRNLRQKNLAVENERDKANKEVEKKEAELQKRKKMSAAGLVENEAIIREEINENLKLETMLSSLDTATEISSRTSSRLFVMPVLPVIANLDDPQKGRFGGKSEVNNRKLSAIVTDSRLLGFFNVTLKVTSTQENNPISSETYFYLHDTFLNPVRKIFPENGEAVLENLMSYGAFTVGVITDFGQTVLELDLSEGNFPKRFIEN